MLRRIRMMALTVSGLAALALGGAAISGAAGNGTPAKSKAAVHTTKQVKKHAAAKTRTHKASAGSAADTDNVQEGDQTGPETPDANEAPDTGSESATETPDGSDGPGGHADEANGNPNADTQQSGQN
jgi:hypothetical protein